VITLRPIERGDIEVFYEQPGGPGRGCHGGLPTRDRAAHFDHWTRNVVGNPRRHHPHRPRSTARSRATSSSWMNAELGRLMAIGMGWFWGRGVATEGVHLYLAELVNGPLRVRRAAQTSARQRVLEKNGFTRVSAKSEIGDRRSRGAPVLPQLRPASRARVARRSDHVAQGKRTGGGRPWRRQTGRAAARGQPTRRDPRCAPTRESASRCARSSAGISCARSSILARARDVAARPSARPRRALGGTGRLGQATIAPGDHGCLLGTGSCHRPLG